MDTIPRLQDDDMAIDTSLDYDDLFNDLKSFMDSLLRPRSYFQVNVSASSGYFNFKEKNNTRLYVDKKIIYAPSVAYFHKSGLGLTVSGNLVDDEKQLNFYQYAINPSIDFLNSRKLIGGIGYTRYITKDSLPFYTTPIKNELSAYITWRKPWLQSSLSANYGWGSLEDLKERLSFIERLWLRRRLINFLSENETVSDFSLSASFLHNFYWLQIFSKKDNIRLTPQVQFTSGTQRYGLNQPLNNTTNNKITRTNALTNARELMLDNKKEFKPVSLSLIVKTEYGFGKFFIQPQFILDYYFPAKNEQLSTLFSINAGLSF